MAVPVAPMVLLTSDDDNRGQFTMQQVVDIHVRGKDLSMVYTNGPVSAESSIQTMDKFVVEDKYQVASFDLEFTRVRAGQDQKVADCHSLE
ncbi:putative methyltransferase PMT27 [Hordeum vulgare]|nr:putative methyltransferase PMT27 [Hordeum vulgare]